jgi:hypothetical protein
MVFDVLFSYSGIIIGFILSFIAPDELKPGKRYFRFLQQSIFGLLCLLAISLLVVEARYFYALLIGIATFPLAYLRLRLHTPAIEFVSYGFMTIPAFLIMIAGHRLLFLTFIFLYGFPTGTLIRLSAIERRER